MRAIPRHPAPMTAAVLILILGAGSGLAASGWGGRITEEKGIPLVANPAEDPGDLTVLEAQEAWRLGGDNEDDPLLGNITDARVDADGNAYLLDSNLSRIHVMSPRGEHLRVIGHEGDGPGEFRSARRLALMPDGKVAVMEMMPGQIVMLEPDGTPAPTPEFEGFDGGMRSFNAFAVNRHGVILGGVNTAITPQGATIRRTLGRFDLSGAKLASLKVDEETQTGGAITLGGADDEFTRYWSLFPDGRVALFGREHDYRIEIHGLDGKLERIVTRDYEPLRRTDEDLAAQRKQNQEMSARFGGADLGEVDPLERTIRGVIPRPDGSCWVADSRGARACPPGAIGDFDVLDGEGRLVRTLRIPAEYDRDRDRYLVRGGQLFVLKEAQMTSTTISGGGGGAAFTMVMAGRNDEDEESDAGPFEVICYRLGD